MKHSHKKYIIVAILIVIAILLIFINKKLFEKDEEIVWNAKYIWGSPETVDGSSEPLKVVPDTWMCFRKNFEIDKKSEIKDSVARIAVDSKYWLYINGKLVVKEGALKRGEALGTIYYDEVSLDNYLQEGENTIAVLVWYFGKNGYSHIDTLNAGLLFEAQIGKENIISDSSWKVQKNPAYLRGEKIDNYRLSEPNIYYNANLAIDNWYEKDYDDSSWENATIRGDAGEGKWGDLIARDIPFFYFGENIKEYENFEEYRDYKTVENEVIEMKLPYNMQVTPYLKVEAEANKEIIMSPSEKFANAGDPHKTTYITKDGVQEFESLAWVNGEKIYYSIPADVKIISLGYRETKYDTEISGKFNSNDEFLNELWTKASRTLLVNMRDNYMDCPDRERAQWAGDMSVSMEEAQYSLDSNSNYLFEKGIRTLIGWRENSVLLTVSPSPQANLQIPIQNLLAIQSVDSYYNFTANTDFLKEVYPYLKDYLNNWKINDQNLVEGINDYSCHIWNWSDSVGEADSVTLENAEYYYALKSVYNIAKVLNYKADVVVLQDKMDRIYKGFNENFWKEYGYKSDAFPNFDQRANAIAVLSGLASKEKYESILKILEENRLNSPLMEKYVLEAMCEMGNIKEAEDRMKIQYKDMVEDTECSTLWEFWVKTEGSTNHAWAGGPLVIMSRYFAGISPLTPAYQKISIKPNFADLKNIETEVDTVQGKIKFKGEKTEKELKLNIEVPKETLVAIEKMSDSVNIYINDKEVCNNGTVKNKLFNYTFESEDGEYMYFYLKEGNYEIISK